MDDWNDMNAQIDAVRAIGKTQGKNTSLKRERARRSQKKGDSGGRAAKLALELAGVAMVEKISTPVILRPARVKGTFYVSYGEKVSGDLRGIMPGSGQSVLAEVKSYDKDRLPYSALRKHQPERLSEHEKNGGLSLLIWVNGSDVFIIEWPIVGFQHRSSLSIDYARQLSW